MRSSLLSTAARPERLPCAGQRVAPVLPAKRMPEPDKPNVSSALMSQWQ